MKHNSLKYIFLITSLLVITACRKSDYYQTDPNNPSQASPALLLTNILYQTFNVWPMDAAYASRHMTYYERPSVYVNYGWSTGSFGDYDVLRQVMKLNELATTTGDKNYEGISLLMRAVHFIYLTEQFGDVPYSEALKALDNNVKPKYDAQEDVYAGVLGELEQANSLLDPANGPVNGDIIYSGDVTKWKKFGNAFRLRVLMHLSNKIGNTKINVQEQFQSIINDPSGHPIFESTADNAQLVFNESARDNSYPTYQSTSVPSLAALEKSFVNMLKDRLDPRLFSIAEPIMDMPANEFDSYAGVDAGGTVASQQNESRFASKIARRYVEDPVNEPMIFLGYAEQEFLIAEAISRGWITGDAEVHYNNGITASMQFYGIDDDEIENYINGPLVKFNSANAIQLIIGQKYISFFMNSYWEPFFEQRRTGIPALSVGPGTLNNGLVPKRWMYPQSEFNYNQSNVAGAVEQQFGGTDDTNGEMWLLK